MARTLAANPGTVYDAREGDKFSADTTLVVETCPTCGIVYAIPASLERSARRWRGDKPNGWRLCCPLGHTWWYVGETDVERERSLRRRAQEDAARLAAERDQAQADARAQKAAKTRFRRERDRERAKTKAGRCPCCEREFKQLARHMASQHPDWPGEGG